MYRAKEDLSPSLPKILKVPLPPSPHRETPETKKVLSEANVGKRFTSSALHLLRRRIVGFRV